MRPRSFAEFVGQVGLCDNLDVAIRAATERREPLDHVLFVGPPGLGKTTLAYLIATGMAADITVTAGPVLASPRDLMGPLARLEGGDVLFVDEIHRLPRAVEEYLYAAMEDQAIDIVIDSGPSARTVRMPVNPFTLIGATTREGLLTAAFRSRFGLVERLEPYPVDDIRAILQRAAGLLTIPLDADAAGLIARHSRGVPRHALRILRRIRDLAQVQRRGGVDLEVAREGLSRLRIDELGLEELDRRILRALATRGEPTGLKTLAAIVDEAEDTLADVFEPHLIRSGLIARTPRGRIATAQAYAHLGLEPRRADTRPDDAAPGAAELPFEG